MSHFFACIWVLIGQYNYEYQTGWIKRAEDADMVVFNHDFWNLYLTAFYWVITTFTSVGYGDIIGVTDFEYFYKMILEMVSIGFFGYILGTCQTVMQSFGNNDRQIEMKEKIDHTMMKLEKAVKDNVLLPSIYIGVQDFFEKKYTLDAISVQKEEFFQQLKPRIQRNLLDLLFQNYYEKFKCIFEEFDRIDPNFKRDVFRNCEFTYCQNLFSEDEDLIPNDWPHEPMVPEVIKAGKESKKVYFILFG